jgi:hypothetical protein
MFLCCCQLLIVVCLLSSKDKENVHLPAVIESCIVCAQVSLVATFFLLLRAPSAGKGSLKDLVRELSTMLTSLLASTL